MKKTSSAKRAVANSLAVLGEKVTAAKEGGSYHQLPITNIAVVLANRDSMTEESLSELAESIRQHGVQEPILVRPGKETGQYELIAGERRLRASLLAGRREIPAIVKHVSRSEARALQATENIHRLNLTAMEEAKQLQAAMDDVKAEGVKKPLEHVAKMRSKSISWVSERLQLLKLSAPAAKLIKDDVTADLAVIAAVDRTAKLDAGEGAKLAQQVRRTDNKRATARAGYDRLRKVKKAPKARGRMESSGRENSTNAVQYAERLIHTATARDRPSPSELRRRVRATMQDVEPRVHKVLNDALKSAHSLGRKLRKSGPRQVRHVSDEVATALDDGGPPSKHRRVLLLKAFAFGVTGQPFDFESVIAI